VLYKKQQWQ